MTTQRQLFKYFCFIDFNRKRTETIFSGNLNWTFENVIAFYDKLKTLQTLELVLSYAILYVQCFKPYTVLFCSFIYEWHIRRQNKKKFINRWKKRIYLSAICKLLVCWHWSKMSKVSELLGLEKVNRLWAIIKHNGGIRNSLHKLYKWVLGSPMGSTHWNLLVYHFGLYNKMSNW